MNRKRKCCAFSDWARAADVVLLREAAKWPSRASCELQRASRSGSISGPKLLLEEWVSPQHALLCTVSATAAA